MKKRNAGRRILIAWLVLALLAMLLALTAGAAAEGTAGVDTRSGASINVQNGSFEEGQSWTDSFKQLQQGAVPKWYTSAKDERIELFRENTGVYIPGVKLTPPEGTYAAELNADEESTLYQALNTQPSSIYEWSLSHGARTEADIMALIVGPNQSIRDTTVSAGFRCLLSKPDENGRDQFMQMIDWLKAQGKLDGAYTNGLYNSGKPITLYSKKFADNGAFQDNAGNNPFSLTPSPFYTQKWQIWLMKDTNSNLETTNGTTSLKWSTYGSRANQTGANANSGLAEAYYRYTVPTGQRQTLFGFVSVSAKKTKNNGEEIDKTYGNFLDDITFTIYHPLTASTTPHGSAIIISTLDNKQVGQYEVKPDQEVDTYVQHGVELNLTVDFPAKDVTFAGVYYKTSNGETVFIANRDDGSGNPWKEDNTKKCFTYKTAPVETGVELYFVFIKSPMVTYDPNGGDPYDCGQTGSGEAQNVYSFKPNETQRTEPYTAYAATKTTNGAPDEGWRFTGWRLSDDNNTVGTDNKPLIIPGAHKVACNYDFNTSDRQQPFVIIRENESFDTATDGHGTLWSAPSGITPLYNKGAMGLTLVAQWQWRQTFVPCVKQANGQYVASQDGGTVTINKTDTEAAETYGISYFAEEQETITVTATAKPGYTFEGWYDEKGELKVIESELTYEVGKGDVRKYYARFVANVMQTYIRQIPDASGGWIEVTGEKVAALDHTGYAVGPGTVVTSTPGADTEDYVFEGWYDSSFNKVADSLVLNNGRTLSYEVTGSATYYARFVPRVRFEVRYVDGNNDVVNPPVPGETYGTVNPASVGKLPGEDISSTASANPGYRFVGWYDGVGADKTLLGSDATYTTAMPPVGKTYYAMFTAGNNSRYTVQHIKVKPDGSTEVFSEAIINSVPTGTAVSAQAITIPGYTYRADRFTVNGTDYYQSNPSGNVRGDGQLVLKLYYTPTDGTAYRIEHYQVDESGNETLYTFTDHTGKTDEWVIGKNHDTDIQTALTDLGYALKEDYPKSVPEGRISESPTLVLKLYYVRITHRVTFDRQGHGSPVKDQIVPHNGQATQPADLAELGYVFGGWYRDPDCTQAYNFADPVTQDITIYAKWSKLWTVSFDMQGHGEPGPAAQKVLNGEYAADPTPTEETRPTAEGYTFEGWYTDAKCITKFDFAGTQIKRDTIVYAKWLKNITVTKVWENAGAQEVRVLLLRDGQPVMEADPDNPGQEREAIRVLKADQTNAENNWKAAWNGLPDTGRYTVQELDIPENCTAVYSSTGVNQFVITNIGDRKLSVTVKNTHSVSTIGMVIRKEWDDANNRNRPGSIRVQIKDADTGDVVQEQELNAGNNWTWTVTGLKKYHDGGKLMRYVIDEAGVNAGYMVSCDVVMEQDGSYTVKLTNVLTGKMDIGGTKLWNDGGNRDGLRPDSLYLMVYQNSVIPENLVQVVLVEPEAGETDSWGWTVKDLPMYDSFGRPITYIVVEDPVPEGYADPGPIFVPAKTP